VEIVLTNEPGERQRLLTALETFAREQHLPEAVRHAADLALEEHLTNIVRYGYGDGGLHEIRLRFEIEGDLLKLEVVDDGKPFDPLQRPEVDTSVPLEKKPVGGLGIHLIRQFMDQVQYRREGDKNVLTMRKRRA
jgi:anti-sigma regulatory factor (Ser/Thr protein kinase)